MSHFARAFQLLVLPAVVPGFLPSASAQVAHADAVFGGSDPNQNGQFGSALSLQGERMLVGAAQSNAVGVAGGAGYVFEQQPDGSWVEVDHLLPAPDGNSRLGYSVALDGDRALLGGRASREVYVFEQDAGAWPLVGCMTDAGLFSTDLFGSALDLEGDRALIGNSANDDLGPTTGAAHVYELQETGWTKVADLYASEVEAGMDAGSAVSLSGSWAAVGALDKGQAGGQSGAVYLFQRQLDGTWLELDAVSPPGGGAAGDFGRALSLEGDWLLVGAPADATIATQAGKCFLYQRQPDDTWALHQELLASDAGIRMRFGESVCLSGDRLSVGTLPPSGTGSTVPGVAYVFERGGDGQWTERVRLRDPNAGALQQGGFAVAVEGDLVISSALYGTDTDFAQGTCAAFELRPLMRGAHEVSLGSGGTQDWALDAGEAHAGEVFALMGSASGSSPGVSLAPGITLPLNVDAYWSFTLTKLAANPLMGASIGLLDANGRAASSFLVPAGALPPLVGLELQHAYALISGAFFTFASNPVAVTLGV